MTKERLNKKHNKLVAVTGRKQTDRLSRCGLCRKVIWVQAYRNKQNPERVRYCRDCWLKLHINPRTYWKGEK